MLPHQINDQLYCWHHCVVTCDDVVLCILLSLTGCATTSTSWLSSKVVHCYRYWTQGDSCLRCHYLKHLIPTNGGSRSCICTIFSMRVLYCINGSMKSPSQLQIVLTGITVIFINNLGCVYIVFLAIFVWVWNWNFDLLRMYI